MAPALKSSRQSPREPCQRKFAALSDKHGHESYGSAVEDELTRGEPSLAVPRGAAPPPEDEDVPPLVAGYDLLRVLGRGGMGVVWEAVEHRLERRVALKVHREVAHVDGPPSTSEALWTEAFVAARIGDPSIVQVLDVGYTLDRHPYYSMELVDGTDLSTLLADGPLAPRRAIAIAADMARAAAAAHQRGVIHRDLKPRNVIVDKTGRARVVDFGIAFDSRTGVDAYAGMLAGSPPYMSPEAVVGNPVTAATDIWAIGVMLYEMLTGERPFVSAELSHLFAAIVAADPPRPSTRRDGIHADVEEVVLRCLAKAPADRFASAGVLFETLGGITEGQRVSLAPPRAGYAPKLSMPPSAKPPRKDAKKQLEWSWILASTPERLWPYVADTDRFNKAVGLTPVSFTDATQADGSVKRTGEIRVLGLPVSWREYPFEWIQNREHAVFRWYGSGPLSALWNRVKLTPLAGGGTELKHEIWLSPRGVIGHVAAFVEIERKLGPAMDRFYRHLDEVLVTGGRTDPFEPPHAATAEQRALVESGCARLHQEGFSAPLVEKIAMLLLVAPDGALQTLRPYALADAWGHDRAETADAFIHAARLGLLEPMWDVICPKCMIAHESHDELSHVTQHGSCTACATSFERDLGDSVELVFAPHASIRALQRQTYCAGSPGKRPHIVVQQVLEPGEEREVSFDLTRGSYRLVGALAKQGSELIASAVGFETTGTVEKETDRIVVQPAVLAAGKVSLTFVNAGTVEETFRIEHAAAREDAVSAAAALTHPSFRQFFSDQLLATGEHVRVSHMAFVFVELVGREILFETLGDGKAALELSRLDGVVHEEGWKHEGELVPSALSKLVLAFTTSDRAFKAALAIRRRIAAEPFAGNVAIALHGGKCIALTRSGKPEFFGETLHRGEALLADCPAGGMALSAAIAADRGVALLAQASGLVVTVERTAEGPYAGRRVTLLLPP